eukprot:3158414-Heterocapsa_arctica.AAC.1
MPDVVTHVLCLGAPVVLIGEVLVIIQGGGLGFHPVGLECHLVPLGYAVIYPDNVPQLSGVEDVRPAFVMQDVVDS